MEDLPAFDLEKRELHYTKPTYTKRCYDLYTTLQHTFLTTHG
jgi:hypothetical protein